MVMLYPTRCLLGLSFFLGFVHTFRSSSSLKMPVGHRHAEIHGHFFKLNKTCKIVLKCIGDPHWVLD